MLNHLIIVFPIWFTHECTYYPLWLTPCGLPLALYTCCLWFMLFCFYNTVATLKNCIPQLYIIVIVTAFGMMIVIALIEIIQGNRQKQKLFNFRQLPDLFGVCIYSFMCQHSLPGMITPMKSKKYVFPMLAADYGLIFIFYSVMCYTAVY